MYISTFRTMYKTMVHLHENCINAPGAWFGNRKEPRRPSKKTVFTVSRAGNISTQRGKIMSQKRKAYVLMSGGLDSTLAAKILIEQGIEVTGLYFSTGFCISAQQKRNGRFDEAKPDLNKVIEELGIDLEVIDISGEYLEIVTQPRYGWGKNINPCVDCRIHMLQKAKELMEKTGYDFIATGEVLGQRPMSQLKHTSRLIEKRSDLEGYLLRPLSAKFHPKTIPEEKGWVDREKLHAFSGRSRKPQLALAKSFQLQNIQTPAGGCCYLTDEHYAVKFKDLLQDRNALLSNQRHFPLEHNDMILMSIGRHIKLRTGLKFIAGRDEAENKLLDFYKGARITLDTTDKHPGPLGVIDLIPNEEAFNIRQEFDSYWESRYDIPAEEKELLERRFPDLNSKEIYLAASILLRYGRGRSERSATVIVSLPEQGEGKPAQSFPVEVVPYKEDLRLRERLLTKHNEKHFLTQSA